jgi:tRNA-2-methylthio-N6-dimethylallyladenosine synthase
MFGLFLCANGGKEVTKNLKKLYIKTYGCQMNVYDSNKIEDLLRPLGYESVDVPDDADMMILNTCHIREKATEKVYSDLGRLHPHKDRRSREGKDTIIVVAGCVAQAEGDEIIRRAKYVDMVVGPQTYHHLPEMIAQAQRQRDHDHEGPGRGIVAIDFDSDAKFDALPEASSVEGPSAFLTIQEGCDKFCHFCCVPYTRGAEFSRPVADVLKEAKHLVSKGVHEIFLLGQNVNAYHGSSPHSSKEWGLGRLLRELAEIDGLERLRYMTSHPRDVDDELIEAHRDVAKVMPYLHLPVQSGSDHILKAMNRKHTADEYFRIIDRLREVQPGIAFSSDFIVGYPGETDKDFQDTLNLVEKVFYAQCYSFKYSPRPGTPAAAHELQVPEKVKDERLAVLQDLLRQQQDKFNADKVGQTMSVLFEKAGRHEGQLVGKSPYLQSVFATGNERLIGQVVDVEITQLMTYSLGGEIVTKEWSNVAA